jgi:hypothetical protein
MAVAGGDRRIEVSACRLALDEQQPWRLSILRCKLTNTIRGPERLVVLWQRDLDGCQVFGEHRGLRDGEEVCRLPPKHVLGKPRKIGYLWEHVIVCITLETGKKTLMVWGDMSIDVRLGRE